MKKNQQQYELKFKLAEQEFLKNLKIGKDIKTGEKISIMARQTTKEGKFGKRFAYIGEDNNIHVGRKGKPLKVKPSLSF